MQINIYNKTRSRELCEWCSSRRYYLFERRVLLMRMTLINIFNLEIGSLLCEIRYSLLFGVIISSFNSTAQYDKNILCKCFKTFILYRYSNQTERELNSKVCLHRKRSIKKRFNNLNKLYFKITNVIWKSSSIHINSNIKLNLQFKFRNKKNRFKSFSQRERKSVVRTATSLVRRHRLSKRVSKYRLILRF